MNYRTWWRAQIIVRATGNKFRSDRDLETIIAAFRTVPSSVAKLRCRRTREGGRRSYVRSNRNPVLLNIDQRSGFAESNPLS